MNNFFSIIIPAYNRGDVLRRTVMSIINQTYPNYELIIVDDGSNDNTQEVVSNLKKISNKIRLFMLPENSGRLVARNIGMRLSRFEWICWLDSDDEYMSNYLEVLNDEINRDEEGHDIYNFATFVKNREMVGAERFEKGFHIRDTFKPEIRPDGKGHVSFESGHIGTGSFIFRRKLLEEVGYFPETKVPYGSEESLPALWVKKDPAMAEICKQNESGSWLPLGNPWGDDYSFFWRLTRNHISKPLDVCLYLNHIRD